MYTKEEITNKVFCGDARLTLKEFPSESIDMCITSPPYFRQRRYFLNGTVYLKRELTEEQRKYVISELNKYGVKSK